MVMNLMSNLTNTLSKVVLSRRQFKFAKKPWITIDIQKSTKKNKISFTLHTKALAATRKYKNYTNMLTRIKHQSKEMYYQHSLGKCRDPTCFRVDRRIVTAIMLTSTKFEKLAFITFCLSRIL